MMLAPKAFGRMLCADIGQSMGWHFLLSIVSISISLPMDTIVDWQWLFSSERLSVFYFYFHAVQFGGLFGRYFTSMFCALPYAIAFCIEYRNRMCLPVCARAGMWQYCISKFSIGALSGGIAMSLGTILFIAILAIPLPLRNEYDITSILAYEDFLANGTGMSYFVSAAYFAFLSGTLWGGVAVAVSAFIPNIYAVIASPFVAFFTIAQFGRITGRTFPYQLDRLLSMRIIVCSEGITIALTTGIIMLILTMLALLFVRKARRRIVYG